MTNRKIIHFESCNFLDFPIGGTLSFARQFSSVFNEDEIVLVGISDKVKYKKNSTIYLFGRKYQFYGFACKNYFLLSFLPARIIIVISLILSIKKIKELKDGILFTQSPEIILFLSLFKWSKSIFCFAGLSNSVAYSKNKYLRVLGPLYEKILFILLKKRVNVILAASSKDQIEKKLTQMNFKKPIIQFPTRFDEMIFFSMDRKLARNQLGISNKKIVIVTTGRITFVKGWDFLLESFRKFLEKVPDSQFIFVGDGNQKGKLEIAAYDLLLRGQLKITGFVDSKTVSSYLNSCDVFVLGSIIEGWPTAVVEALACGCNIVSTEVSGIDEMVNNGKNGFICTERDASAFSNFMINALELEKPNTVSLTKSKRYSKISLRNDFEEILSKS